MATKREMSKEKATAAILKAAAEEFADSGYNGATIRTIAARAGVANGLVCTYFESKEKLLCEVINEYSPEIIYKGYTDTDPYKVFCAYLDHIRWLQKNDPVHFRLHLNIVTGSGFPESVFEMLRKGFEGSPLETAFLTEQKSGQLMAGDTFRIFKLLSGSVYALLNQYAVIGEDAPNNDAILNIIGYKHDTVRIGDEKLLDYGQSMTIAEYMISTASAACYCDLSERSVRVINHSGIRTKGLIELFRSFDKGLRYYLDNCVHPDDKERVLAILEPGNIRGMLREKRSLTFSYRDISAKAGGTYRGILTRGEDEEHAWLFFFNINEELQNQQRSILGDEEFRVWDELARKTATIMDISGEVRKKLEQQKTQELIDAFSADYEAVFLASVKDGTYKVIAAKKELSHIFDGKGSLFTASDSYFNEMVHPADRERVDRERIHTGESGEKFRIGESNVIQFRSKTEDGYAWYRSRLTRISKEKILVGFKDCTEEIWKDIVEKKLVGEYIGLYVINTDTDELCLVKCLQGYQIGDFTGKAVYSHLARRFSDMMAPGYRENAAAFTDPAYLKKVMSGQDHREYTFRMSGTEKTVYRVSLDVLERIGGEASLVLLSFTDITKQTEEQLLYQQQLEEALAGARSANKAKTDFLFNMSHDMRTPLNAILGYTDMAVKHLCDREKTEDCLLKVRKSGELLLSLINGMLDLSSIENGDLNREEEKCDMAGFFERFMPSMTSLAGEKGVNLYFDVGIIRDRYVYMASACVDRILINLISNAIMYSEPGGHVRVSVEQMADDTPGSGSYRFVVFDDGIGMSEEFQKHMYDAFAREKNSTLSGIQGTGLGLPLVRKLISLMDGTISCRSNPGKGTVFTVVLSFRLQEPASITDRGTMNGSAGILKGKRILLVEDNELNREIAADILSENGMITDEAENGAIAADILKARGPKYYDCILMDIQMPVMNGFEATKAIRNMHPDTHIPIIALSANAFAEDRADAFAAGMDDHVAKPIDVPLLLDTLARFIKP